MNQGTVYSLAVSPERGQLKKEVPQVQVIANYGIKGDGHAGNWGRQITCLARQSVVNMIKEHNTDFLPGDFAENIQIEGLDFSQLGVGVKLKLGNEAVLEITQIGKEDHPSIVSQTFGVSLLPSEGLFCKVLAGGMVHQGDPVEIL